MSLITSFILRGARVIDPANGTDAVRDVAIADGFFVAPENVAAHAQVIQLSGKVITPGLIDIHVHLRDPGQLHKEDVASGTRAAAAGGFTSVIAMPNTMPPIDSPEQLARLAERCRSAARVHVLPSAALTVGRKGQELTSAAALKAAGAVALTDDGTCVQNVAMMLQAVEQAAAVGLPISDHCEDAALAHGGAIHAGAIAKQLGVKGMPPVAEELMIARDALLAQAAGHPIHIQHLSTATGVDLVRWARQRGQWLTAEACPHHLFLTDAACVQHGANAKMNPPLRPEADRLALVEGLRDGTITVIATDHAPHTPEEKAAGLQAAPCGIIGLETALPLCLTQLYHAGILTLPQLIAKFTLGPRQAMRLQAGTLSVGAVADLTVIDTEITFAIDIAQSLSRSRNTPFHGWACRGRAVATMVAGQWVHSLLPTLPVAAPSTEGMAS